MARRTPSLVINAISSWAALFVQIGVGFFLTPFIISHLGQGGYGIWVLVGSFIGYYGLLNLGVGSAITRYIARFSAQNDSESLNKIANTALAMFCATGAIAILLSFWVAEPLALFFKIAPELQSEFKRIVLVLGIATGLSFPSGVFSAMITARERYVAVNFVNITATLLRTVLTVAILLKGQGLAGIAYPTLAATVLSLCAFVYLARMVVPEFRVGRRSISLATLKMLLIYGGYTTVIAVADILRLKIDSIVIGKIIGMPEVGIYAIAALLIRYMLSLVTAGMGVLGPRFATLDGAEKKEELQTTFLRALSVSSFIACGVALMLLVFGQPFIFLWVGREFVAAVPVLSILALSYALALSQSPGITLMYAMNKHKYYAAVTIAEALVNVLLSIVLAIKYGIIGVALGTAIPMLVVKLLVQPLYVSRLIDIRLLHYIKAVGSALLVLFVSVLLFVSPFNFIKLFTIHDSYLQLCMSAGLLGTLYLVVMFLISPVIRNLIVRILQQVFSPKKQV